MASPLLRLLLLCALVLGVAPRARAAPACPEGTLVIGTDATFPPFASKVGEDYVGYEIDLGEALGRALGCEVRWVNSSFDGIFPALLAGKYDMVLASVTITDERRRSMRFSKPYMDAGQAIAVRRGSPPLADVAALDGLKVGVGLNTTGQYLLEPHPGIVLTKYPSVDLALSDLQNGRLDAAVGDRPVFAYMIAESFPDLALTGEPLNTEQWGIAFAPDRAPLVALVDAALDGLRADGTLAALDARYLGGGAPAAAAAPDAAAAEPAAVPEPTEGGPRFRPDRFAAAMPLLLTGARWTLVLSLVSFAAALPLALLIAIARGSRSALLRAPAAAWVELLRGTPLLVQIFFIYFVLPGVGLTFDDFTTAVIALSINASAYVSEIFRAGLESIDHGQSEAAEALGMSRAQALRHVLVPQAVRRVVPPLTNEAIALIKESSLVSVMGLTELTRTGQELASRYADPLTIWPGVALCYFLMTFPLARLSARLERRLKAGQRQAREG